MKWFTLVEKGVEPGNPMKRLLQKSRQEIVVVQSAAGVVKVVGSVGSRLLPTSVCPVFRIQNKHIISSNTVPPIPFLISLEVGHVSVKPISNALFSSVALTNNSCHKAPSYLQCRRSYIGQEIPVK